MVAEPVKYVDVESAVRDWARDTISSVGRRVFFGPNNKISTSQLVVSRIAGVDSECLIQFDVWPAANGGKAAAQSLAAELATAADKLSYYVSGNVLLKQAVVEQIRWQPDEESNAPRYIVEVTFSAWPLSN